MKPNIRKAACLIALALAVGVIAASSTLGPGSISSAYAARSPQVEAPPAAPPPADASIDEIDTIDKAESITLEPSAATVTANDIQYFVATVRDKNGKVISDASVKWSANAAAGRILLSGKLAATFQATTTVGFYPSAVTATTDKVSSSANVTVTPGLLTSISVSPPSVVLVANATQSFTASGYDADNNPISGLSFTWSISPGSGVIVSSGPTTATLRAGTTLGLFTNAVRATSGSVTGAATVEVRAVNDGFTPSSYALPIITTGEPDNHTACTALLITPPATVDQSANNAFNIYRFSAASDSYRVRVENYATTGQLLLYRIVEDNCARSGTLSVTFITAIPITSPAEFLTTLSGLTPNQGHLLAVNTTGALTPQVYRLIVQL